MEYEVTYNRRDNLSLPITGRHFVVGNTTIYEEITKKDNETDIHTKIQLGVMAGEILERMGRPKSLDLSINN